MSRRLSTESPLALGCGNLPLAAFRSFAFGFLCRENLSSLQPVRFLYNHSKVKAPAIAEAFTLERLRGMSRRLSTESLLARGCGNLPLAAFRSFAFGFLCRENLSSLQPVRFLYNHSKVKAPAIAEAFTLERLRGIEPLSPPWQGGILPLNHSRSS